MTVIHDEGGRGESAYIVRDHSELLKMLEEQQKFSGRLSKEQIKTELAAAAARNLKDGEEETKRVSLPADKFNDFREVHKENEEEFEYVISCIVI